MSTNFTSGCSRASDVLFVATLVLLSPLELLYAKDTSSPLSSICPTIAFAWIERKQAPSSGLDEEEIEH